ncbi:MAG: T9SS type A sorting domain-containing protein [Bacteroidota bacterium]
MKKILQIASALVFSFSVTQSKAQLDDGSIASNFTFVDMAGNTQDLYAMLDSGKTVFIDISAAWCAPCWDYHTDGHLEGLYNTYGPAGTNEVRVLFIEGELTNTDAQLTGTNAGNTYAGSSQGNWVAGTPYPIVNLSTATTGASAFMTDFNIGYFPTIYMVCPDRSVTLVGPVSTAALYAAKSACGVATAAVDGEMITALQYNKNLASCDSVTPTFRLANIGTTPLTSATITLSVDGTSQKTINWTGSLATYESTTVTGVKVGSLTPGTHAISAVISSPNGIADPTVANNSTTASFLIYPPVGGAFISETFESAGIPNDWAIVAGGNTTWEEDLTVGYSSTASAKLPFYNIGSGQVDYLVLAPMSFAGGSVATLSFKVAYAQYSSSNTDRLQVEVSTNCGTSWVSKFNKSGATLKTVPPVGNAEYVPAGPADWRQESVNLNTYAGQTNVLVRFKGTSDYGNDLFIDDVNFSSFGVGIEENELNNNVLVYPNPIANNATVAFNLAETNTVSISMVNALGQAVMTENLGKMNAGDQTYSFSTSSLNNGLYFMNIKVGNNTIIKKVTISK